MFDNSTEDDAIVTMFALERVPVILVMLCWFPSNVWTFLVPAMALFFLSNFFYMRCYLRGPFNLDQKVFEKLGVSVKETTERKRNETRNREIQSLEKERKNLEDKVQVIKALEKEIEKHEEDRREWDAEKKNLEDKVQVMKALEKEREDRCEWDVKKMKLENKGKLINALGKEIEKHEEDRHKWEGEKKNLEEKLSSISDSLSEEYVESGRRLEGKVQEIKEILEKERVKHEEDRHDWENEKKNLQEKISVLRDLWRSLSELYKVCRNKWEKMVKLEREKHEEDFRKWEEERNQLIDNLGAATASSQRYRELLHDLDKN